MASRSSRYNYQEEKTRETKKQTQSKSQPKIKTRKRIKLSGIFFLLVLALIIYVSIYLLLKITVSNIYIQGNSLFSDQEIIELAKLQNYPSILRNTSNAIEKRLNKNIYIRETKVKIRNFREIYIEIKENKPIFYNEAELITVLENGETTKKKFNVPILINYVPDSVYKKFIEKMGTLKEEVQIKISEIKYEPNEVDEERFVFIMNDENTVIINITRFNTINNYISIIKNFENQKGTLHLDSGQYFDIKK